MLSIWNVSWVARTLTADPSISSTRTSFIPIAGRLLFGAQSHRHCRNPGLAVHQQSLRHPQFRAALSFSTSLIGAFLLARRLSGGCSAAIAAAVMCAFCPYFFSHGAHIQLLMGGGIPLSLLMLHRLADAPSPGRGVHLGLALAVQALACASHGIFAGLMVGYATIF